MTAAGIFLDPERCLSATPPSACCNGVFGNLVPGCRVSFPRTSGSKGVLVGSRNLLLFWNPSSKYKHSDSSPLAIATNLRNINSGSLNGAALLYSRPLTDNGTTETPYTTGVDEVFRSLHKNTEPFDRSQNIWVLLYAPTSIEPPYIVMGRFRYVSYVGGALCIVAQDELVADRESFDRILAKQSRHSIASHAPYFKMAADLEAQAQHLEDMKATHLVPSAKRARTGA
jgi:hypothetical protein